MAAYVVGLITGAIVTIFPLIYAMSFDHCQALVVSAGKSPTALAPSVSPGLVTTITIIGAVVLLLNAAMLAFTGLSNLGFASGETQKPEESPDEEPDESAETEPQEPSF
ncbi:MAG: hypothetical protein ACLFWL_08695 [Candidatus Brocadiia bacterium]